MAHVLNTTWPEKKRIEAVTTYIALGKLPFVSQVTGVPHETLRAWKKQEWWKDLESQIKTEENQELDTRLTKIIDKSLSVVVDRLEKGDFFLDKTGKAHRVPVKLKDANKVTVDLLDKRSLLRKEPTRHMAEKQESINERLLGLAEQFAAIALGKDPRKAEKIIEGEVIDAVSEEWEEGLQTGTGLGTQEEAKPGEGPCPTESSEEYCGEESGKDSSQREGCWTSAGHLEGWAEPDVQPDGPRSE